MLAQVALVRSVEVGVALRLIAPGARTHVGGHHLRAQGHLPSEVVGPSLPVRLLGVEEEAFVERADLGQRLGPQQQHRADQEIGAPTQSPEAECLQPCSGRRGEGPTHPGLLAGDRVHLGRRHAGQVVGGVEPVPQPGDGVGGDRRIGIEEQQIVGARRPGHRTVLEADVHPGAEAQVPSRVDVGRPVALDHGLHRGSEELSTTTTGNLPSRAVRQRSSSSGAPNATTRTSTPGHHRHRRPTGVDLGLGRTAGRRAGPRVIACRRRTGTSRWRPA